tara:strand:+ start:724 stop:1152 length:429 start_codon:yes stop_codon:yes gene_type:complete
MAYVIFDNNNNLIKIAANDSDRDSQNIVLSDHTIKSVSDSDFLEIRTRLKVITYDGTNVILTDHTQSFENEINLKEYLKDIISVASNFLKENESNSLYNPINEYKNYLESFDTSLLSFPYEKSIEQYCNENSLPFFHPLQIP